MHGPYAHLCRHNEIEQKLLTDEVWIIHGNEKKDTKIKSTFHTLAENQLKYINVVLIVSLLKKSKVLSAEQKDKSSSKYFF